MFRLAGTCLLLTLLGISLGCSQPNFAISFQEFMTLQRDMDFDAEVEATAAANEDREARTARIDAALGPYHVGPGDVLTVTLSGLDVEVVSPVTALVHRDGTVMMPNVGKLKIAGLTLEEIENVIHDAYVPNFAQDMAVYAEVTQFDVTDVMVVGAVRSPGLVTLRRDQRNLLYAVLAAGGVTEETSGRATLERLRLPAASDSFDLTDPAELEAALTVAPLETGDVITVEAAFPNTVFVGGLVNAPAPQMYPAGVQINFLQAIAAAGGVRTDIFPKEGLLVRRMPNGNDLHVKLDLERLASGLDKNFLLQPGDIIWVPETFDTRFQDFVNRNLFFRAGISVTYDPIQFENTQRALRQSSSSDSFSRAVSDGLRFGLTNTVEQTLMPTP